MERDDLWKGDSLEIWNGQRLPSVGMDPSARLRLLTEPTRQTPPRQIHIENGDPFGFLEHNDTYEALATQIFTECEGIYTTLANTEPCVIRQLKRTKANSSEHVLEFPVSQLGELYAFRMIRTESEGQTTYDFARTDRGYEDKGFRVVHTSEDHFVLRNLEQGDTDLENNEEYFALIVNAQKWVRDYAASLTIKPESLLQLADQEIRPYSLRARLGRLATRLSHGSAAGLKVGSNALVNSPNKIVRFSKAILTKPEEEKVYDEHGVYKGWKPTGRRRVRLLGVMAFASVMPTSLQPTVGIESFGAGVGVVAGDIFNSRAHSREDFDRMQLQLPQDAATDIVEPVETDTQIPYVTDLDPRISKSAPNWGPERQPISDNGNINNGSIRRLDGIWLQDSESLSPGACSMDFYDQPQTGELIKAIDTNPYTAGMLTLVARSPYVLHVCNTGTETISPTGLHGIYLQFFTPKPNNK